MLKLYNTLTRKKEEFRPLKKGHVGLYTCGPTVYNYAHIGNLRTYVNNDVIKRVLLYNGFKVKHVMNYTDVGHLTSDSDTGEDKMEVAKKRERKTAWEIAKFYIKAFEDDVGRLNILPADIIAKATDHIKEQIELIKRLWENELTYVTDDGIYFDTSKLKDYGKLARLDIKGLQAGKRIEMGEKKNPTDFALWKFSPKEDAKKAGLLGMPEMQGISQQKRDMEWDFMHEFSVNERQYEEMKNVANLNSNVQILNETKSTKKTPITLKMNFRGFPGWHIECSAMSMKYLGETFDIHTGGIDHIPIHHTNEIAQAEGATGKRFVNYWLHSDFLIMNKGKMAKSSGEFLTLQTLIDEGCDPLAYRYFCLTGHYRTQLIFSYENLDASKNAYESLKRKMIELRKDKEKFHEHEVEEYKKRFLETVNDDFNMPGALALLNEMLKDNLKDCEKYHLALEFDKVFGLNLKEIREEKISATKDVQKLLDEREKARKVKDFKKSDELREQIKNKGFNVLDTAEGQKLQKL